MNKNILLLIILCAFLFFFQITKIPLFDGAACMYGAIAKNIISSGNWMTMVFIPGTIFDKPPLVMWLNAVFFQIFGVGHFAANLWHGLMALFTVLITYWIAKELFDKKTAFYSGVVLATAGLFFYLSRVAMGDIPLTFFTALCFWMYLLWERKNNFLFYALNAIFLGISILVKGPVSALFVLSVIIVYHITVKRFPDLKRLAFGALIFLAVALPWFIAEYLILGKSFLKVYEEANIVRFFQPTFGAVRHYRLDFYNFIPQLLVTFIPWAGFIGPAIYYMIRGLKFGNIEHKSAKFILCWIFVIFFICSISGNYKMIRYLLPLTPALAIVIGKFWKDGIEENGNQHQQIGAVPEPRIYSQVPDILFKISHWTNLILVLPLILLAVYLLIFNFPADYQPFVPVVIPLVIAIFIAVIIGSILGLLNKQKLSFATLAIFTTIAYGILLFQAGNLLLKVMPPFKLTEQLNQIIKAGDRAGLDAAIYGDSFLLFYVNKPLEFIDSKDKLIKALSGKERFFYISEDKDLMKKIRIPIKLIIKEYKLVYSNK